MTDDAVGLVNRNLGYPPPFGKGSRDCDDSVPDGIFYVNYFIFYCKSRVVFRMQQHLRKQRVVLVRTTDNR